MCGLKYNVRVTLIALIIHSGHLISTGRPRNGPAEILWNLSQIAVQGRQYNNKQFPTQFQLSPEKFSKYTGPIRPNTRNQYGHIPPHFLPTLPRPIPALPPGYQRYPQSFMEALDTVALNDDLRCVPRLLCELTSGLSPEQKRESHLPLNINTDSLLGVLSTIGGPDSSVLLQFGRAALLGYTAKGSHRSCSYAYPTCPQDPDRLVEYLNNHKGGLFRYFNGLPLPQYPQHPNLLVPFRPRPPHNNFNFPPQNLNYPPHYQGGDYYKKKKVYAERRIQNRVNEYNTKSTLRFPNRFEDEIGNELASEKETFVFPDLNEYKQQADDIRDRKQKAITFPATDLTFPRNRPSPNRNRLIPTFPDRTGTGELRLDAAELGLQ